MKELSDSHIEKIISLLEKGNPLPFWKIIRVRVGTALFGERKHNNT